MAAHRVLYSRAIVLVCSGMLCLTGCHDPTNVLSGHSYSTGDWLLVKWDGVHNKNWVIDDEQIMASNSHGIKVNWEEEHAWTTCDGGYKLFKDGELVHMQDFLDAGYVNESESIRKAYIPAEDFTIESLTEGGFLNVWDSLKNAPGNYPTRYLRQPANKDIVWCYRYAPSEP